MEQPIHRHGLIDTDILIDASRGLGEAGVFLNCMQGGEGATVSIVTAMELIAGCRDKSQLIGVRRLLAEFHILPLTEIVSTLAYGMMESLTLGHGLLLPDALIAATALANDLPVYTRNIRHFRAVSGLEVIKPY